MGWADLALMVVVGHTAILTSLLYIATQFIIFVIYIYEYIQIL